MGDGLDVTTPFGEYDPRTHPPLDGYTWEVGWMSQHLLENMTPPPQ